MVTKSFDIGSLLNELRNGLGIVQALAPLAVAAGAPEGLVNKVTGIAGALIDTAENVNTRIDEGKVVATSTDQDQLKAIVAAIQAENDELDKFIDEH